MLKTIPITTDPEIQGGIPCFTGTRVPVRSLFDVLKHGRSIDYFISQFSTVTREQVEAVLGQSRTAAGESKLRDFIR
jgi:uncharacterized protein (DUF433 family)